MFGARFSWPPNHLNRVEKRAWVVGRMMSRRELTSQHNTLTQWISCLCLDPAFATSCSCSYLKKSCFTFTVGPFAISFVSYHELINPSLSPRSPMLIVNHSIVQRILTTIYPILKTIVQYSRMHSIPAPL